MKKWPEPKLCLNCKWSKPERNSSWSNDCWHPIVIMSDNYALANNMEGQPRGSSCSEERSKRFSKCGMVGRLYECKE